MKKTFNSKPSFAVGDQIKHPKYGKGYICKVDGRMFPDYDFFYYTEFNDKTKAWLPRCKTERDCKKVS